MISVVVPTLDAERTLAVCLMGLTRAAIDGLVRDVIVADGGSGDATAEVADDAGAKLVSAAADRGARLAAGCAAAANPWILTLRQDAALLPGWEQVVARHIETAPGKAAWFALEPLGRLARLVGAGPADGAALLIPAALYRSTGGFAPGAAEKALAGRLGRIVRLDVPILSPVATAGRAVR